jgi:hypothetical protein
MSNCFEAFNIQWCIIFLCCCCAASAALPFLSPLLVIDPMRLQDMSFSLTRKQIKELPNKNQNCWGTESNTFILHASDHSTTLWSFGHATFVKVNDQCNGHLEYSHCQVSRSHWFSWTLNRHALRKSKAGTVLWSLRQQSKETKVIPRGNISGTDPLLGHPSGFPGPDRNSSPR